MKTDVVSPTGPESIHHRAAAYVRMSTEHQQYSTCNQMDVIRSYAARHNLEVVKEYCDEGKSGLRIKGRAALSQMIREVLAKETNFKHILVYDISRWGRFQDPDEAAHYEFLCRRAGVAVHYCAEPFVNEGGLPASIAKIIKRAMAGEFSRELSAKVCVGAARQVQLGHKQGGPTVIGLRRLLVDENGRPKMILQPGEHKSLATDRVIFVPGPAAEIEIVREIFRLFVSEGRGSREIASILNQRGIPSTGRCPWTECKIRELLRNEKYIGNLVHSRRTRRLGTRPVANPPESWVRKENAFAGIVPRELFFQAQELFKDDRQKFTFTNEDLLEKLRTLLRQHGRLTSDLINASPDLPKTDRYWLRFGGVLPAYRLIGYQPRKDFSYVDIKRRLNGINDKLVGVILRQIKALGVTAIWNNSLLVLNGELRVWVVVLRHNVTPAGASIWLFRRQIRRQADFTMVVRMARNNEDIQDYYLLPGLENTGGRISLGLRNGTYLDGYRFESLDFLVGLASRVKLS